VNSKIDIIGEIKKWPGYKISDSHFRIGSKIHISDFYYAKRFFQNGFFASRMAFVIANDLVKIISQDKLKGIRRAGLTLIGYGIYSELLVSMIERFLKEKLSIQQDKLNHNLIRDSESIELVKQDNILGNVIIVVPIASTFSTSIKIEEMLLNREDPPCIIPPHINVLVIQPPENDEEIKELRSGFGWEEEKNLKEIPVRAFFAKSSTTIKLQKYYLSLPTTWYGVDKCKICFPQNEKSEEELLKEMPLFETDRTSVTLSLIFGLPKGRLVENNASPVLTHDLVQYGHHTRNNSHFVYSIRSEEFFSRNMELISKWLVEVQKALFVKKGDKETENDPNRFRETDFILIISSCHYSNAGFLNLVNEKLFSVAANIIHYDPRQDYIQNFEMMYGSDIQNADKIVFVDDALKSGETFSKIHEFIHYMEFVQGKGICVSIFLMNLANPFTMRSVMDKMVGSRQIYSYCDLNLFTSLNHDEISPLVVEEDRYRRLVVDSFLDSLKMHFIRQASKLTLGTKVTPSVRKMNRHLKMLAITHQVYQYFTERPELDFETFEEFRTALFKVTTSPVLYTLPPVVTKYVIPEWDACLLKVLTQSPFVQYEPLKTAVFKWVLQLLDRHVKRITELMNTKALYYEAFEDLKFLIRRAGLLNSNYLISRNMFEFLKNFYEKGIPILKERISEPEIDREEKSLGIGLFRSKEKDDKQKWASIIDMRERNISDFTIFYAAQVKELLLQNEARSIRLESILIEKSKDTDRAYHQLLRILRVENSVMIKKFWEAVQQYRKSEALFEGVEKRKDLAVADDRLEKLLNDDLIQQHPKWNALSKLLADQTPRLTGRHTPLFHYLWIQYFIAYDRKWSGFDLESKTGYILKRMKQIVGYENGSANASGIGGFFIVRDSSDSFFVVYDKNKDGVAEFDSIYWRNNQDIFLQNFLKGEQDNSKSYHKSIIELKRTKDSKAWQDIYATKENTIIKGLSPEFLPRDVNRILIVRIDDRQTGGTDRPQGIIVFYFRKEEADPITDIGIVRYLHLLRASLSEFVQIHYENDEFQALLLEKNEKKILRLAGHGKEVLKKLADEDPKFARIARDLTRIQVGLQFGKDNFMKDLKSYDDEYNDLKWIRVFNVRLLEEMARKIYVSEHVEDKVACDMDFKPRDRQLSFTYPDNFLNLIFFEIFVNAKKNRWIFLRSEKKEIRNKNKLILHARVVSDDDGKRKLIVIIKNTCPALDYNLLGRLKNPHKNAKPDNEVSGTSLLKKLICDRLKGAISYEQYQVKEMAGMVLLTTRIELPEMKEE